MIHDKLCFFSTIILRQKWLKHQGNTGLWHFLLNQIEIGSLDKPCTGSFYRRALGTVDGVLFCCWTLQSCYCTLGKG